MGRSLDISGLLDSVNKAIEFAQESNEPEKTITVSGMNDLREAVVLLKQFAKYKNPPAAEIKIKSQKSIDQIQKLSQAFDNLQSSSYAVEDSFNELGRGETKFDLQPVVREVTEVVKQLGSIKDSKIKDLIGYSLSSINFDYLSFGNVVNIRQLLSDVYDAAFPLAEKLDTISTESANAISKEGEATKKTGKKMKEAAKDKESFANANKKVKKSADDSVSSINKEAEAAQKAKSAFKDAQKAIDASKNIGVKYNTSEINEAIKLADILRQNEGWSSNTELGITGLESLAREKTSVYDLAKAFALLTQEQQNASAELAKLSASKIEINTGKINETASKLAKLKKEINAGSGKTKLGDAVKNLETELSKINPTNIEGLKKINSEINKLTSQNKKFQSLDSLKDALTNLETLAKNNGVFDTLKNEFSNLFISGIGSSDGSNIEELGQQYDELKNKVNSLIEANKAAAEAQAKIDAQRAKSSQKEIEYQSKLQRRLESVERLATKNNVDLSKNSQYSDIKEEITYILGKASEFERVKNMIDSLKESIKSEADSTKKQNTEISKTTKALEKDYANLAKKKQELLLLDEKPHANTYEADRKAIKLEMQEIGNLISKKQEELRQYGNDGANAGIKARNAYYEKLATIIALVNTEVDKLEASFQVLNNTGKGNIEARMSNILSQLGNKGYSDLSVTSYDSMKQNAQITGVFKGQVKKLTIALGNNGSVYYQDVTAMQNYSGAQQNVLAGEQQIQSAVNSTITRLSTYVFSWYKVFAAIKSGIENVKEFDSALLNISYTMDLSDTKLESFGEQIKSMAKEMSASLEDVASIAQIYANMQTSTSEILEQSKATVVMAGLTGTAASEVADQIQAVTQQFGYTADQTEHIADVYDHISKNIAVDYSKGIKSMAEGVEIVGSTAAQAGLSFEQLSAIMAKVQERSRLEGSQIARLLARYVATYTIQYI